MKDVQISKSMFDNVLTIKIENIYNGWHKKILLSSDQHHDSIFCDRKSEKEDLDMAMSQDALIFFCGDLFDAMQGKKDPRASYDHLESQLKTSKYFDALVKMNAEFYKPYAKNIMMIGAGNHETSVLRHHNTSLIDRLVENLRLSTGSDITVGNYGGWIRFMFEQGGKPQTSVNLKYFHGAGGESPQSKGMLQSSRQSQFLPDAHIVWNGHNHNEYVAPFKRDRLSNKGKQYQDCQWHVRTPGYKNDYANGSSGFPVENGHNPKPIGCIVIDLFYHDGKVRIEPTLIAR